MTTDESGPWGAGTQARLREPFPDEDVRQYDSGRGMFSYITARDVMNRLDDVVGAPNWSDEYRVLDQATGAVQCWLTVLGVTKSNVGYPNTPIGATKTDKDGNVRRVDSPEPLKDAFSDALKRAAVHFGVGRHLYDEGPKGGHDHDQVRPASDKQVEYVTSLLTKHGFTVPALDTLDARTASDWIEQLKTKGPQATLLNKATGEILAASGGVVDPRFGQAKPTDDTGDRRATANQAATIEKLSRLLGRGESADGLSFREASDRVRDLSREYNERKGGAR